MAFPPGAVFGESGIEVGEETLIGQLVTMSAGTLPGQDLCQLTVLTIGDRCVIGRGSHIVAHQSVTIGDDVWTGPYVYITDQNHGYEDPDAPIGSQFPVNRPVSIGEARGWARGPSSCRAPASAATWWSRQAPWSAAKSRTSAWWQACPRRSSASTPRQAGYPPARPTPARPGQPVLALNALNAKAAKPVDRSDAMAPSSAQQGRSRQRHKAVGQRRRPAHRKPAQQPARRALRRPPRSPSAGKTGRIPRGAAGLSGTGRRRQRPSRAAPTDRTA